MDALRVSNIHAQTLTPSLEVMGRLLLLFFRFRHFFSFFIVDRISSLITFVCSTDNKATNQQYLTFSPANPPLPCTAPAYAILSLSSSLSI